MFYHFILIYIYINMAVCGNFPLLHRVFSHLRQETAPADLGHLEVKFANLLVVQNVAIEAIRDERRFLK